MNIPISILDRLKTQHLSLPIILSGLGIDHWSDHPITEKWSIRDNVAHLARYQLVFMDRIHILMKGSEPVFEAYRAEDDLEFEKWQTKSPVQLTETLNGDRQTLTKLVTSLNAKEMGRIGVHAKFGRLTILDWTEFFLLHEAHHLFTIFRLAHEVGQR
jgi:hypothetical protein